MPEIQEFFNLTDIGLETFITEGTFECHALGKKAFVDSRLNCWLFQLPFILENFGFGYICFGLIIPIMLISIFGKIKHSYRWFILNQAIWDFFIIYNFICDKPTWNTWFETLYKSLWFTSFLRMDKDEYFESINQKPATCFYSAPVILGPQTDVFRHILATIFDYAIKSATYSPLFLLTLSRFVNLYYHYFYTKCITPFKISLIIIGTNVICISIVNLGDWYSVVAELINKEAIDKCAAEECKDYDTDEICSPSKCWFEYINDIKVPYFIFIKIAFPCILLIFSNIFAFFLILKLFRQFKFQIKYSQNNFIASLRIAGVIFFQCLTMSFLFVLSFTRIYFTILRKFFLFYDNDFDEAFLSWLRFLALSSSVQCFNAIRIFLDSLIVLCILPEYRRNVVKPIRFCIGLFMHPKRTINQLKSNFCVRNRNVKIMPINTNIKNSVLIKN